MRLVLVIGSAALLGAAPPATRERPPLSPMPLLNPQQEGAGCPDTPMSLARRQGERLAVDPLYRLPPAQAFAAVDRRVAGCPAPMLLSEARAR